jgi:hypothetical protein
MKVQYYKTSLKYTVTFLFSLFIICGSGKNKAYGAAIYEQLKGEFDSSADIYYYSQDIKLTISDYAEPKKSAETKEIENIKNLAEKWNETIKSAKIPAFYTPRKEDIETVEGIYDDDSKILALLKDEISLDLLLALAIYKNPMILSAQKQWKAAIERFSQISSLDLIMRDYVSFTQSLSTKIGPQRNKKMVQMKFPFPGMLSLKGEIINKDAQIAKLSYENTQIKIMTMLRKTYYSLLFVAKEEDITKKTLKLLQELEKVAQIKYETGKTSFNDVIKVQIKMEKLKDSLKTITEKKAKLKVKMTQLLNLPPNTAFGEMIETKITFIKTTDELYKLGGENNKGLTILSEKIKKMALMIQMAEKKFYPDFTAGYSFFKDNKVMQLGTQAMMEPFMTTPMVDQEKNGYYAKNDAYIREVKEKYKGMLEMLKAKSDKLTFDIKDAYFNIDKAKRAQKLYQTNLIPKAKEALEVADVGYETGMVSFLDVLDANMMWLKFNMEYYKAIRDTATNIADMEKLIGVRISASDQ